ncbi:MAG: EamA family transporter [Devosiaceae bacterium]|nr:EamA family transporter [Devosiaceae bacterium]
MPIRHILLALLVVAIWGFNFVIIKLSIDEFSPFLAAALRFLLAVVPVVFFIRPPKVSWVLVAAFGLAFAFALYGFLNLALEFGMPAGLASVVLQFQVFFTFLLAYFFLGERPRRAQIIGAAIAFDGIAFIALERFEGISLWPFALTLLAALSWGLANILTKVAGKVDPVAFIVWGSLWSVPPLFALSYFVEGPEVLMAFILAPSFYQMGLLIFLSYVATLFGMAAWTWLLTKHPASVVAPFTLLVPITGLASGWLVLGERISYLEIFGGALVVFGLWVSVYRRKPQQGR